MLAFSVAETGLRYAGVSEENISYLEAAASVAMFLILRGLRMFCCGHSCARAKRRRERHPTGRSAIGRRGSDDGPRRLFCRGRAPCRHGAPSKSAAREIVQASAE